MGGGHKTSHIVIKMWGFPIIYYGQAQVKPDHFTNEQITCGIRNESAIDITAILDKSFHLCRAVICI